MSKRNERGSIFDTTRQEWLDCERDHNDDDCDVGLFYPTVIVLICWTIFALTVGALLGWIPLLP